MNKPIFVVDTNVFISAQLIENSVSAQVFDRMLHIGSIALSEVLLSEYRRVLYRKKLDKYLSDATRELILQKVSDNALIFIPTISIEDCRDHQDNMILELALSCGASCIVTGDEDLLVMHPFRSVPILSGADFLKEFGKEA